MVRASHERSTLSGNVAEIYAQAPIEAKPLEKPKKKRIPRKTLLIIVSSALVTFLVGVTLLIVFK